MDNAIGVAVAYLVSIGILPTGDRDMAVVHSEFIGYLWVWRCSSESSMSVRLFYLAVFLVLFFCQV